MTVKNLYGIILRNGWRKCMQQIQYIILKVSKNGGFAFFECSNGDYGILEPQNCEVAIGDVLYSINTKDVPYCGVQSLLLNGTIQVKVYVDDLNFKDDAYKLFCELSNKYE